MSTKQKTDQVAKLETAFGRCFALRDKRDAALKTAAAALTRFEAMVDSDTATQAEIDATEVYYEDQVGAFFQLERTLSAACLGIIAKLESDTTVSIESEKME